MSEKGNHVPVLRRRKSNLVGNQYRRRSKASFTYQAQLNHVLGLTLKNNCSFTCDPHSGLLAYPAGCVIVLFNPRTEKQSHIFNPGQKTLTCMRFSNDGTLIVTGESGHQPCVRVFSVQEKCQVNFFSAHKFGISCVAFSPNSKYAISIGHQHDMLINVWDLKRNTLAASNKVSTKIKALSFADDSSYFVTVGNRLVKFWYLDNPNGSDKTPLPLKGRPALLESLQNHMFCDVTCAVGVEYTYACTKLGILCQFTAKRTVKKHIQIECGTARSLSIFDNMILCGCAQGCIHIYDLLTLDFIKEITPPAQIGSLKNEIIAMAVDVRNLWMHCVFADHSIVIYDMMDSNNPEVTFLSQYHNSCVWDVKMLPYSSECTTLPTDCFITCSSDGTARAWTYTNTYNLVKVIKLEDAHEQISGNTEVDGLKTEARSLCIRHDGRHLAVGDKTGNIHIFDLETFEKVSFIPTHDGDVLCLDFISSGSLGDMLASASRDRCVHTFVGESYTPTHTISDHSASVSAIKFAHKDSEVRLITCGSDKSLYFCGVNMNNDSGKVEITREQHIVEKHSMVDMTVLDDSVLVACGSNLREYDIIGGKLKRCFRGSETTQTILRVTVDDQRTMIATSCSDKNIYILGFVTTDCMCVLSGHSEVVVSLEFDLHNHLLSASADSCVFVWELNHRVALDVKSLNNVAPTSAGTTPEADLNTTEYFGEVNPSEDLLDVNFECTPRSVNGDVVANLFNDKEHEPENTSIPIQSNIEVKSNLSADLPSWVLNHQVKNSEINGVKTNTSLEKFGAGLEQEKITKEMGKWDLISVSSFIDNEKDLDTDEISSQGEIGESLATELKFLNETYVKKVEELEEEEDDNTASIQLELSQVLEENSSIINSINKEINLSLSEITQKENKDTDSTENSKKTLKVPDQKSNIDITADLDLLPVKDESKNLKPIEFLEDSLIIVNSEVKNKDSEDQNLKVEPEIENLNVLNDNVCLKNEIEIGKPISENQEVTNSIIKPETNLNHPQSNHPGLPTHQNNSNSISDSNKNEPESSQLGSGSSNLNISVTVSSTLVSTKDNKVSVGVETSSNHFEPDFEEYDEYVDVRGHHFNKPENLTSSNIPKLNPENMTTSSKSIVKDSDEKNTNNDVDIKVNPYLATDKIVEVTSQKVVDEVIAPAETDFLSDTTQPKENSNDLIQLESNNNLNEALKEELAVESDNALEQNGLITLKPNAINSKLPVLDLNNLCTEKNKNNINIKSVQPDPLAQDNENLILKKNNAKKNDDLAINKNCEHLATFNNLETTNTGQYLENGAPNLKPIIKITPSPNDISNSKPELLDIPNQISLPATPVHSNKLKTDLSKTDPRKMSSDSKLLTPKSTKINKDETVIPPGFAQLMASLTKRKSPRSPPKSLPVKKSYQHEERKGKNMNQGPESGDSLFKDRLSADHGIGYSNRNTSLESNTSYLSSNSSNSCDNCYNVLSDCQKVSQDLLAVFSQAEAVYHKQKAMLDMDSDLNDNNNSFNKLVTTFRTVHARIRDMDIIETSDSTLSSRPSLDNLKDDSPVMFLLREYSERFFDLIENEVKPKIPSLEKDI